MAIWNTADLSRAPYPKATRQSPQTAPNAQSLDYASVVAQAQARPSFGARVRAALAYMIAGADAPTSFFGPMQPLSPQAQDPDQGARGRAFDYPVGFNTRVQPRTEEPVTFAMLRNLADGYDLMRLIIETRKDQVAGQRLAFGPKDKTRRGDAEVAKRCDQLRAFFEAPDQVNSWDDWIRMLLEQVLVYDSPALWCEMTRGGELYALQVLDGSTITRKLTLDGRTPRWDEGPAYQQILKGLPAVDYLSPVPRGQAVPLQDNGFPMPELMYRPRNPRVDRVYGYGPVEQVITTVNIALRRQLYQLGYYTDGSTPDLIFQTPEGWNPSHIAQFQEWWDGQLQGNLQNRRGTKFVPHGVEPFDTREKALKDEYDEWLARIICFAFSISPQPFVREMNRATAQTNQDQAKIEGLQPLLRWISGLLNHVITVKFGWPDLTARWEEEEALSAVEQSEVFSRYIESKVYHPDEVREKLGEDPMPDDMRLEMDLATHVKSTTTVLPEKQQQRANEHALALAAARPAPVVADKPAEKLDLAAILKATTPQPVNVTVHPPEITLPPVSVDARTTIAEGAIKVAPAQVTVNQPDITMPAAPDVFVDIGGTHVEAKFDHRPSERTVSYGRDERGNLVGKITDTTTRTVRAERDAAGKLVAKVEA